MHQAQTPQYTHMVRSINPVPSRVYNFCHVYDNHLNTFETPALYPWHQNKRAGVDPLSQHLTYYRGPLNTAIEKQTPTHIHTCRQIHAYGTNTVYTHRQTHAHTLKVTAVVLMEHSEKGK